MSEAKQQTKRPAWIVDLPFDDPDGKRSFTAACRGSAALGEALAYFVYAASYEVADGKADLSGETVSVKRMGETIARYLGTSQKTAIGYVHALAEWKFLIPHSYHHTYEVCYRAIEKAIKNPPEREYPKPRGKHVKREDCKSTNSKGSISPTRKSVKRIELLETQIVNLQTQIVDLQIEMFKLQFQIVDLQSPQSSQGALEAGADAQIPPYILLPITNNITGDYICDVARADITDTHHTEETHDLTFALGDTAGPVSRDDGTADSLRPGSDGRASMVGSSLQAQDKATEATPEVQTAQTEEVTYAVEPLAAAARSDIDVPDGVRRTQEVSDSYSRATPDPLPSVSFLEASTACETGKQEDMGAADENDNRSQCEEVEYVPEWAQGATNGSSAISSLRGDSPGTHSLGEVGTEETKNADGDGSEISSGVDANNPAVQQPDVRNRQPGPASRAAGERRTGERGAGPDTGDDRSVVPNGAAGDRAARGRGGKGTGVAPPVNTTLALPDEGAAWPNVETAILIAEHLRKRAFAPKQREAQEAAARKMFQVHAGLSREQFHNAFESRNDPWWIDHNGPLTIKDLCANDRLQKEMDRLASGYPSRNAKPKQEAPSQRPAPKPTGSPTATGPYTIDEERNKRNIERLLSGVPAKKLVPVGIPMPVMD